MIRRLSLLALGLVGSATALAQVTLRTPHEIVAPCEIAALRVSAADGGHRKHLLKPTVRVTDATTVDVPVGAETVAFEARGCWIEEVRLRSSGSTEARVWPLAEVIARLPGEPKVVRASLVAATANEHDAVQAIPCITNRDQISCPIPANRPIHVRIEWDDAAPVLTTNIAATENEQVDLGALELAPSHHVSGVVAADNGHPIRNSTVRLMPVGAEEMTISERLLHTYTAQSDARGNYRITNVRPGLYRLTAQAAELGDAIVPSLEVAGNTTAPTLLHKKHAAIVLIIDPPTAPDGTPWRVRLTRRGHRESEIVAVDESNANPAGIWESKTIPAGEYTARILNMAGSELAAETLTMAGHEERRIIKLVGIPVAGRLVSNDEGIPGTIEFTEVSGKLRLEATADENGSFAVTFPAAGTWRTRVTRRSAKTTTRLAPVLIRNDTTELELRLPAGSLEGRVLTSSRQPADAFVAARREGRIVAEVATNADGTLVLENLTSGEHTVEAESDGHFAGPTTVVISDETEDIELILDPIKRVRGFIAGPEGHPLSGAIVRVFEHLSGTFQDAIADSQGAFSIPVRAVGPIDVVALAPPYPITARSFSAAQWEAKALTITVGPDRAVLRIATARVPPWPTLTDVGGTTRSLGVFVMPRFGGGPPREFVNGAFQFIIEPGTYRVCISDDCRAVSLPPGAEVLVNFIKIKESE